MIKTRPIDKSYTAGTVIGVMKGPIQGRNWFYTTINPVYIINQNGTGVVNLQGTNDEAQVDVSLAPNANVGKELLPPDTATWSDIATGSGNLSGSFNTQYKFLRLVITTSGTGQVTEAWARWN